MGDPTQDPIEAWVRFEDAAETALVKNDQPALTPRHDVAWRQAAIDQGEPSEGVPEAETGEFLVHVLLVGRRRPDDAELA